MSPSTKEKRVYRVHNLVFAPDLETVEKINARLSLVGNLKSDGRPILGLDSEKLAEIIFNINPEAAIVPAHCWTPWFSVFGSMSGFDSIEECFGKYADKIFAVETGLSSDPLMNRRLSKLDNISLISNSDSHSLQKIGREANIFDAELSYDGIVKAIKNGAPNQKSNVKDQMSKFVATIEFFPEEGKYHFDGHRLCGVVFSPEETEKHKGICPRCGKRLTVGVMNRVKKLADRSPQDAGALNRVPFYSLIPLDEIIAEAFNVGVGAKKVKGEYEKLIKTFSSELKILLETETEKLAAAADSRVAEGIKAVKEKE